MWLTKSSIGRKFVMSITGLCMVLFLLFHGSMNICLVIDDIWGTHAYNWICAMLGANWYAVLASAILALGFLIHIVYAFILNVENRRARGNDRYAINERPKEVEWASQNMLVLGIIVLGLLLVHLYNFWFKMQFAELTGMETAVDPQDGFTIVRGLFVNGWCGFVYGIVYLVWLCAIWFHLSHGIWSALQTIGWSNKVWEIRIRVIGTIFAYIVVGLFAIVVLYFMGVNIGEMCAA